MRPFPRYGYVSYDWSNPAVFQDGKVWLKREENEIGEKGVRWCLFDLRQRKVLGELMGGEPLFLKGDEVVCVQRPKQYSDWMLALAWITEGRIPFSLKSDRFWKLDLKRGSARRMGKCPTTLKWPVLLRQSPDGRFAYYNNRLGSFDRPYFFDIDKNKVWPEIPGIQNGELMPGAWGWWSATEVILKDYDRNYLLYDIPNNKTSSFISVGELTNTYQRLGLPSLPVWERLITVRKGTENDVYLQSQATLWTPPESTLLKVERPSRALTLISTNFTQFQGGEWNAARTHYVFNGDLGSAVRLIDLKTGERRTLADSSVDDTGARLYGEGVIYVHGDGLWMVDLNGSNQVQIFPPVQ